MTISTDIKTDFHFRKPTKDDGAAVWELIKDTGVLDLNSSYSYLMWCEIFSETSIVADREEGTVGFISGFIHPDHPKTLFIWQVAVNESERGKGLGTKMLFQLLQREACEHVAYIEATVSPSNTPSSNYLRVLRKSLTQIVKLTIIFQQMTFPKKVMKMNYYLRLGLFKKNKWIRMIE